MQDLTVTLIQEDPAWENIAANRLLFDRCVDAVSQATDLVVLPEMFTTGFSMNAEKLAQDMSGSSVAWLREKSRQKGFDIVGSTIIREAGRYFNRLIWAKPDGRLLAYDKQHLFTYAGEDRFYASGSRTLTVSLKGWSIRPLICYDLRFPVWMRNRQPLYDAAVCVANWPEKRALHWHCLLQARAIENQCYMIGVNRVGRDGNGLYYSGDSAVIDPKGEILCRRRHQPGIETVTLSREDLDTYRKEFPALKDADPIPDLPE